MQEFPVSLFQGSDTSRQFFAILLILMMLAPTISFAGSIQPSSPPLGRSAQQDPPQVAVKSCINGTSSLKPAALRIAFVAPTFTLTPYANFKQSFYAFYIKYMHSDYYRITADLNWLRTRVVTLGNWSSPALNDEQPLHRFLTSDVASKCGLIMGQNLNMIDDVGVHQGVLFVGSVRQYDVLILGHEEYATRAEYNQFKHFVASGGRIVMMSGNTFWVEVNFTKSTGIETFVAGHGFEFNGAYAWKSTYEPFDKESVGWFGSAFALGTPRLHGAIVNNVSHIGQAIKSLFHNDLVFTNYTYPHNEVNYLGNFTNTQVIARFYVVYASGDSNFKMPLLPVDSYAHRYIKGEVVCLCVFGENLISRDP
ncbi:MAG TPA: N,N-dimethylformamidase beta subunit family domain-containing protein, partial [Nitrososphaerales archaeon]|nr:N,N-dimethylformamidase beta subunit family domain-containing protein [Nitrososphaerales archaeon]